MSENLIEDFAQEIMALVDENPSEPFSLERKWLMEEIVLKANSLTQSIENQDQVNYELGYDEGALEGRYEAAEEYDDIISNLEDRVQELEDQLQDADKRYEDGVIDGSIAARES